MSGLSHTPGKRARGQTLRGFESPLLRQLISKYGPLRGPYFVVLLPGSHSQTSQQQVLHKRLLHMHAVFCFFPDHRLCAVNHLSLDFFAPVRRQAVHE